MLCIFLNVINAKNDCILVMTHTSLEGIIFAVEYVFGRGSMRKLLNTKYQKATVPYRTKMENKKIEIKRKKLDELILKSAILDALMGAGVDYWHGYEDVIKIFGDKVKKLY